MKAPVGITNENIPNPFTVNKMKFTLPRSNMWAKYIMENPSTRGTRPSNTPIVATKTSTQEISKKAALFSILGAIDKIEEHIYSNLPHIKK